MNASTANQILIYMQIAEMEREKEKKRLRSMSPREIKGERRARRRIKARARQFVDDEAEESEGEVEDPEPAEEGFEEGFFFQGFSIPRENLSFAFVAGDSSRSCQVNITI
jgi:hypothetical protein